MIATCNFIDNSSGRAIRELLYHWWAQGGPVSMAGTIDFYNRPIVCTPYDGNHGHPAGWVLCVEGSPTRGTLLINSTTSMNLDVYYVYRGSRKVWGDEKLGVIKRFFDSVLENADGPVTIRGEVVPQRKLAGSMADMAIFAGQSGMLLRTVTIRSERICKIIRLLGISVLYRSELRLSLATVLSRG